MSVAATDSALLIAYVEMPISRISSLRWSSARVPRHLDQALLARFGGERPS